MNDDDNGEWPTNNQLSGGAGGGLCLSVLQLDSFADAAAVLPSHLETFEIRRLPTDEHVVGAYSSYSGID